MIVALKPQTTEERKDQLIGWLKGMGVDVHVSVGEYQTILGLVGDTTRLDIDLIGSLDIVDSVNRITEPFKCCKRSWRTAP